MGYLAFTRTVATGVYREARAEHLTFMAGSIAYHAFASLLPFFVLVLVLVATFGNDALAADVARLATAFLSPGDDEVFATALTQAANNPSLSAVGLLVLLWGTLKIFRSLDTAFSDVYESEHQNTLLDQMRDALVVLPAVGVAVALAVTAGALVDLSGVPFSGVIVNGFLVVALTVAFFPVFYVFPDEDVSVVEVLPGTVLAAVGWTALRVGFAYYAAAAAESNSYGLVGAVLVVVTWLYFGGLVVLLGAALNVVLSGRSEDVAGVDWRFARGTAAERRPTDLDRVERLLSLGSALRVDDGTGDDATVRVRPPDDVERGPDGSLRVTWNADDAGGHDAQ